VIFETSIRVIAPYSWLGDMLLYVVLGSKSLQCALLPAQHYCKGKLTAQFPDEPEDEELAQ